jgi:hypothetical protein
VRKKERKKERKKKKMKEGGVTRDEEKRCSYNGAIVCS